MITHQEIKNLVSEWGLREEVVEKDYVIGWILWGIGSEGAIADNWIFKGGTCLKKCYIETWRFSEDLDFSVLPGGPVAPDQIRSLLEKVIEKVHESSGIDFTVKEIRFKYNEQELYTQGSIYYRGPRNAPTEARIKLDISGSEKVIKPASLRKISHPYESELLPESTQIRCYSLDELFAEKIRAMGERGRPRDLYDIVLLFRQQRDQFEPQSLYSLLKDKCLFKKIPIPTFLSVKNSPTHGELLSEWENMLGHQLPALPPFEEFWKELPDLFNWLESKVVPKISRSIAFAPNEDVVWKPPPTIKKWGFGIPLESIRFAAVNNLCINLGYNGIKRISEPYSLRKTKDGNLILHTIKHATGQHRSYRVDQIESVEVTNIPFSPKYAVEFSAVGPIHAQPAIRSTGFSFKNPLRAQRRTSTFRKIRQRRSSPGVRYVFQCGTCMKKFTKSRNDSSLKKHKDKFGMQCSGRSGYLIDTKYGR